MVDNIASRLPGKWHLVYRFLPDEVWHHLVTAAKDFETALEEMFCLKLVAKLSTDHNIMTIVTANNSKVM